MKLSGLKKTPKSRYSKARHNGVSLVELLVALTISGFLFDPADVFYQLMGGVIERQLPGCIVHHPKSKQWHSDKHRQKSRALQSADKRPGQH